MRWQASRKLRGRGEEGIALDAPGTRVGPTLPASAWDMLRSSLARGPQLLSSGSTATQAPAPGSRAPPQEETPQREARTGQQRSPHLLQPVGSHTTAETQRSHT